MSVKLERALERAQTLLEEWTHASAGCPSAPLIPLFPATTAACPPAAPELPAPAQDEQRYRVGEEVEQRIAQLLSARESAAEGVAAGLRAEQQQWAHARQQSEEHLARLSAVLSSLAQRAAEAEAAVAAEAARGRELQRSGEQLLRDLSLSTQRQERLEERVSELLLRNGKQRAAEEAAEKAGAAMAALEAQLAEKTRGEENARTDAADAAERAEAANRNLSFLRTQLEEARESHRRTAEALHALQTLTARAVTIGTVPEAAAPEVPEELREENERLRSELSHAQALLRDSAALDREAAQVGAETVRTFFE